MAQIIKWSDQAEDTLRIRDALVRGNTALDLEEIPDLGEVVITLEDADSTTVRSLAHQVADQIQKGATQAKGYYDRVAQDDPVLAGYWSAAPTFEEGVGNLTKPGLRRLFESVPLTCSMIVSNVPVSFERYLSSTPS